MTEEEKFKYFEEKEKELKADINRVEDYVNTGSDEEELEAIQGLLDLYNKEKEKSKKCEYYEMVADDLYKNSINKDKIREKIKEYQNKLFQDIEENKVVEYENIIQVLEELLGEKE